MKKLGFTLVELLVVVGIVIVMGIALFLSSAGRPASLNLTTTTQEIATLLREAQNRTLTGDENGQSARGFWGVEIVNSTATTPYYSLFFATSTANITSSVSVVGGRNVLPPYVSYATSSVPSGGTFYVYYSSGANPPGTPLGAYAACAGFTCSASTTFTVGLYEMRTSPPASTTLTVAPTGEVSY